MKPLNREATARVMDAVWAERVAQHNKWGEQNLLDGTGNSFDVEILNIVRRSPANTMWRTVLAEEWAEACAESDPAKLRAELIQVAAVAIQWCEAIDRRAK